MQALLSNKVSAALIQEILLALLASAALKGSEEDVISVRQMCTRYCKCTDGISEADFSAAQLKALGTCLYSIRKPSIQAGIPTYHHFLTVLVSASAAQALSFILCAKQIPISCPKEAIVPDTECLAIIKIRKSVLGACMMVFEAISIGHVLCQWACPPCP